MILMKVWFLFLKVKMNKFFLSVLILLFSHVVSAKQIHIVVLDTGYNENVDKDLKICQGGVLDFTGKGMEDKLRHGMNILGILSSRLKQIDYCVYIFKVYDTDDNNKFIDYLYALTRIYFLPSIDIINYSSNGPFPDKSTLEKVLIEGLIDKNIKFITAAGNYSRNLDINCESYPACYSRVISVGNGESVEKHDKSSNYGKVITQWRNGHHVCANGECFTGTSQSTAIYTSDLAKQMYYESLKSGSN